MREREREGDDEEASESERGRSGGERETGATVAPRAAERRTRTLIVVLLH